MKKFFSILHGIWVPILFVIVTIIGLVLYYFEQKDIFRWIDAFGISTTAAISILAFVAYVKYAINEHKAKKYRKELINSPSTSKAALLIRFGGKMDPEYEMKDFCRKTLGLKDEMIEYRSFGREGDNGYFVVSQDDIPPLKDYLGEFQKKYRYVDEVHILIQGIGITYAVCSDKFSNWKTTVYYHYTAKGYEPWYRSVKNTPSPQKTCEDYQIENV